MAKILNSTAFTKAISKIVELSDALVINGSVSNKTSLSPKSLEFAPIYNYANGIILDKVGYPKHGGYYGGNEGRSNTTIDIKDSSIEYVISNPYNGTSSEGYFYKIVRNGVDTTVYEKALPDTSYYDIYEFIDQDDNYLYLLDHRQASSDCIYRYDKKSGSFSSAVSYTSYCIPMIIAKNESYIYIATHQDNYNYVYKYDKIKSSISSIYSETLNTSSYKFQMIYTPSDENYSYYGIIDSYELDNTTHNMEFVKYTFDITKDKVTKENVTLEIKEPIPLNKNNNKCAYELYRLNFKDKKYIFVFPKSYYSWNDETVDRELYLFEIVNDTTLKYVSSTDFSPTKYRHCFSTNSGKTLVMTFDDGVDFYSFNRGEEKFEKTYGVLGQMREVGIDMNTNIYVQYQDTSVDMISPVIGIKTTVEFDKEEYEYKGIDLQGFLNVSVQNFNGDYLSSNIEIKLFGNVTFADGTQLLKTTTSNTQQSQIPVIVTGPGLLKVSSKIV